MSNKHTPLPWRIQDAEASNYTIEIVGTTKRGADELVRRPSGRAIRDANAELIVLAVNNHEELVKLAESVACQFADAVHSGSMEARLFEQARAVLAKVKP